MDNCNLGDAFYYFSDSGFTSLPSYVTLDPQWGTNNIGDHHSEIKLMDAFFSQMVILLERLATDPAEAIYYAGLNLSLVIFTEQSPCGRCVSYISKDARILQSAFNLLDIHLDVSIYHNITQPGHRNVHEAYPFDIAGGQVQF